jgi:hypothetical protein
VGQSRTVIATDLNGWISARGQGLFVHETRLRSLYQFSIDGQAPLPVASSNIEQHTWLRYYITLPLGFPLGPKDTGCGQVAAAAQNTLELRLARYVSYGVYPSPWSLRAGYAEHLRDVLNRFCAAQMKPQVRHSE